jgi:hypothetical protein
MGTSSLESDGRTKGAVMPRRVRVFPQVALALTVTVGFAVVTSASGPPQFITFPILTHVAEAGLDHGHFVFGGEAAVPTPLARDLGAAPYNPAQGVESERSWPLVRGWRKLCPTAARGVSEAAVSARSPLGRRRMSHNQPRLVCAVRSGCDRGVSEKGPDVDERPLIRPIIPTAAGL